MAGELSPIFIRSIVWIESFIIEKNHGNIVLLTINEDVKEEIKILNIKDIIYFEYSRWTDELEIQVIDTFYEPFNNCEFVKSMQSPEREYYNVIRFHSGEHHLIIGAGTFMLV